MYKIWVLWLILIYRNPFWKNIFWKCNKGALPTSVQWEEGFPVMKTCFFLWELLHRENPVLALFWPCSGPVRDCSDWFSIEAILEWCAIFGSVRNFAYNIIFHWNELLCILIRKRGKYIKNLSEKGGWMN
jgi:hypothetical protein